MSERHRSWHWPLALTGLFAATFGVAVYLQLRDGGYKQRSSAAVEDARMTARHAGRRAGGPETENPRDTPEGTPPDEATGQSTPAVPDDGMDRRSLIPGKGPDYLPEPNEGKD